MTASSTRSVPRHVLSRAELGAYRSAVAGLAADTIGCVGPEDAERAVDILARASPTRTSTAVLDRLPNGVRWRGRDAGGRSPQLPARVQRSAASDLNALIRIWLLSQVDAVWWGETPMFETDVSVVSSPGAGAARLAAAPGPAALPVHRSAAKASRAGFATACGAGCGRAEHPHTAGLRFVSARPEAVVLINQLAAEFAGARQAGHPAAVGHEHGSQRRAPAPPERSRLLGPAPERALRRLRDRSRAALVRALRRVRTRWPPCCSSTRAGARSTSSTRGRRGTSASTPRPSTTCERATAPWSRADGRACAGIALIVGARRGDRSRFASDDRCAGAARRPSRRSCSRTGCWRAPNGCASSTASGRCSRGSRPTDGGRSATTARSSTTASCATSCRPLGHELRSESDTEVVLEAFLEWGDEAVDHLRGEFAFAIVERADRTGVPGPRSASA